MSDGPGDGEARVDIDGSASAGVKFREFLRYFLVLGTIGFGGPIAAVGYMQRDLVEERRWMDRQDLLDGITLGQTMPGPLAAQVAMWVGFLRRGAVGALGPAVAFILPSFLFVMWRGSQLVWLPLPLSLGASADADRLLTLFTFFLKAGAFIFGSGLAIVPFLREGVLTEHHWLTQAQFLDAVAVGLITPGPVVITATFIGFLVAGVPGAIVATVGIFTPIYLGVVIPGRWFVRHRDHPRVRAFVKGATAAAAGAIPGATIVLGRQAIIDVPTAMIAAGGLLFLWRAKLRFKEPMLVLAAGIAGILLHVR